MSLHCNYEGGTYLYPRAGDPKPTPGARVQILTLGGIDTVGPWKDDGSCVAWHPLATRNREKEDLILELNPVRVAP